MVVSVILPVTVQFSSAGNFNSCVCDFTHYSSVQLKAVTVIPITVQFSSVGNFCGHDLTHYSSVQLVM